MINLTTNIILGCVTVLVVIGTVAIIAAIAGWFLEPFVKKEGKEKKK